MKILKEGSEKKLKQTSIKKKQFLIFNCYWCGCKWESNMEKNYPCWENGDLAIYSYCPFCKRQVYYDV